MCCTSAGVQALGLSLAGGVLDAAKVACELRLAYRMGYETTIYISRIYSLALEIYLETLEI